MSEKLSNAIARSIDEQGYQKRPDGVFALCNIHPSGLTTAELERGNPAVAERILELLADCLQRRSSVNETCYNINQAIC